MTVKFSNLQLNVVRLFMENGHDGVMTREEFSKLNQSITSSLGRRRTAILKRTAGDTISVTKAGREAWALMMHSDQIYRMYENTGIARCFESARNLTRTRAAAAKETDG